MDLYSFVGACAIICIIASSVFALVLAKGQDDIESKLDELLKRKDGVDG